MPRTGILLGLATACAEISVVGLEQYRFRLFMGEIQGPSSPPPSLLLPSLLPPLTTTTTTTMPSEPLPEKKKYGYWWGFDWLPMRRIPDEEYRETLGNQLKEVEKELAELDTLLLSKEEEPRT